MAGGELNQRNLRNWVLTTDNPHGFADTDRHAWGGLLVRWDAALNAGAGGWVRADAANRAEACITEVVGTGGLTIEIETLGGEQQMPGAIGVLNAHTNYYCDANGDVTDTPNGQAPILRHLGSGVVQFYASANPPVSYNKLRLTANQTVPPGSTVILSDVGGGVVGTVGGVAMFDVDTDFNQNIVLEADAPAHKGDDNLLIVSNVGIHQRDSWTWVDVHSASTPAGPNGVTYDVGDTINFVKRQ